LTRDLRSYSKQTNKQLIIGFFVLLFGVGVGLIYWIYGKQAAILSVLCILGGLAPVGVIWLVLAGISWIAKKADE
jgi:hypothetical protein